MEVWQSAWPVWNWISLARWQDRLAAGRRLAAIGGSDFHQPDRLAPRGPLALGRPTTVLWLPELSEDAVLAAMKAGRGYVTEAPDGPHLAHHAPATRRWAAPSRAGPLAAEAQVRGAAGDTLVWIDASGPVRVEPDPRRRLARTVFAGAPQRFLRAEIVAEASRDAILDALPPRGRRPPAPRGPHARPTSPPTRSAAPSPTRIYVEA